MCYTEHMDCPHASRLRGLAHRCLQGLYVRGYSREDLISEFVVGGLTAQRAGRPFDGRRFCVAGRRAVLSLLRAAARLKRRPRGHRHEVLCDPWPKAEARIALGQLLGGLVLSDRQRAALDRYLAGESLHQDKSAQNAMQRTLGKLRLTAAA